MSLREKLAKQCRCIRRYAKSLRVDVDDAGMRWVAMGLAKRWAEGNV